MFNKDSVNDPWSLSSISIVFLFSSNLALYLPFDSEAFHWFFFGLCFVVFVCFSFFCFNFHFQFFWFPWNFSFELFLFWLFGSIFLFHHVCFLFLLSFFVIFHFTRDVRQPLSQIRLSLSASLGVGQVIFLAGVNATEHTVRGFSGRSVHLINQIFLL